MNLYITDIMNANNNESVDGGYYLSIANAIKSLTDRGYVYSNLADFYNGGYENAKMQFTRKVEFDLFGSLPKTQYAFISKGEIVG